MNLHVTAGRSTIPKKIFDKKEKIKENIDNKCLKSVFE